MRRRAEAPRSEQVEHALGRHGERVHGRAVAPAPRELDRGVAARIAEVSTRASLDEQAHHRRMAGFGGAHERGVSAAASVVERRPAVEEQRHRLAVAAPGREDPLFEGLPGRFPANLVHHDSVAVPPPGYVELAASANCRFSCSSC